MRQNTLNLAVIGGCIKSAVGTTHNVACRMDHRFNVSAAVFSLDNQTNHETAEQWKVCEERLYSSHNELLENEKGNVDAVAIITPTQTHADISIAAIKAGYPVICEKSLTTSVADALRIKQALTDNNGFLAVTYNYTGYPMVRQMRALIQDNAIGKICQINIEMPQDSFIRVDRTSQPLTPQAWRLDEADLPIVSTDLGVHLTNVIAFLSGEKPIELIATQNSYGNFDVIDTVNCLAHYTNDLVCNIWFSKISLGYRNGLKVRVFGDRGSIIWKQVEPETLRMTDANGTTKILDRANTELALLQQPRYNRFKAGHPAGYIEAFANCYADIYDAILDYKSKIHSNSPYVFGVTHAINDMNLIDAMNQSANNKQWVQVGQL